MSAAHGLEHNAFVWASGGQERDGRERGRGFRPSQIDQGPPLPPVAIKQAEVNDNTC